MKKKGQSLDMVAEVQKALLCVQLGGLNGQYSSCQIR